MDKIDNFSKELEILCNKYGFVISGKTTNGAIIIKESEENISCTVKQKSESNAFIYCGCK